MTKTEKLQMQRIMKNLKCDEETAKDIMETDKRIDRGEKLFELPEELKEGAKKARSAGNCAGYTKTAKEKPQDADKRFLMETFELALSSFAENEKIINPEREMTFEYKGKKYKVVLSCPRT